MADGLLEVRGFGCSRFQNATGENVIVAFSDTMTLYVHSGYDESDLAPDYERYGHPSAPTR
jgi:serine kinase of HPr protein (carbohydrate metabolism regulator)